MTLFEKIGEVLFSSIIRPHQRRVVQYARLALKFGEELWHAEGDAFPIIELEEPAKVMVAEYERQPLSGLIPDYNRAKRVLEEIERRQAAA